MSQSPIQLGATYWWRCDQGLTMSGIYVTGWQDVISNQLLIQPSVTASWRPKVTNGRLTSTAVWFDAQNAYMVAGSNMSTFDTAAHWKWLADASTPWHIFCCDRVMATRSTYWNGLLGTSYSSSGAAMDIDMSPGAQAIRIRNNAGGVIYATGNAATMNTPGFLAEFLLNDNGGAGNDFFYTINGSLMASAAATAAYGTAAANPLIVGNWSGYNPTGGELYGLNGYIEDLIIFKKVVTGTDLTDLRNYIRELRGVPTGVFLAAGNTTNSYVPVVNEKELFGPSGDITFGFIAAGDVRGALYVSGDVSTGFETAVYNTATFNNTKDVSFGFETVGELHGPYLLTEDISCGFEVSGILGKDFICSGDASFGFDTVGDTTAFDLVAGDVIFAFDVDYAYLDASHKGLVGDIGFGFAATGTVDLPHLEGHVLWSFEPTGELALASVFAKDFSFGFEPDGNLEVQSDTSSGHVAVGFDASGYLCVESQHNGAATFGFDLNHPILPLVYLQQPNIEMSFVATGSLVPAAANRMHGRRRRMGRLPP